MKKLLAITLLSLASAGTSAQAVDIFNHLGAGVGVGTSGISVELATPITSFVQMRAGVSIMPGITFNADADFTYEAPDASTGSWTQQEGEVSLKGDLGRVQGQVIFNVYPIPKCSFFVAAGAYFGGNTLLKISGHSDELAQVAQLSGSHNGQVIIGDYTIPANENGDISGGFKVNSFRPYLGIGWGRSIPGKFLSFTTELGVQFEGKPDVYSDHGEVDLSEIEDDNTFNKIRDVLKVYPTLTFRLNFRAF